MSYLPFEPTFTASENKTPDVARIGFGDGYEQRIAKGINNLREEYQLSFTRIGSESDTIMSFFEALGGTSTFDWKPFNDTTTKKFVCNSWSRQKEVSKDVYTITANVYRVYE